MYNSNTKYSVKLFHKTLCLLLVSFCTTLAALAGPFTLVIDPGHGGKDAGAVGTVAKEKTINLNVALAFGKLVEQNCPDVRVIYTRKTDVFVSLEQRANIANRNKADLFISIHTNAVASNKGSVYGAETYTLGMHRAADNLEVAKRENSVITMESDYKSKYQGFDPNKAESYIIFEFMQDKNMAQSVKLAKAIQQQYAATGRKNKGVHQAGFLVLRETSMPSVLTELGFISNPNEEAFLNSSNGVSKLAQSIYNGFRNYRKQLAANYEIEEGTIPDGPLLAENVTETPAPASTVSEAPAEAPAVTEAPVAVEHPHFSEGASSTLIAMEDVFPSIRPIATKPYPAPGLPIMEEHKPVTKVEEPVKVVEEPVKVVEEPAKVVEEPVKVVAEPSVPEFRIQLFTSEHELKANDPNFKGLSAECYKDGGMYKYTYGRSTNYNEIVQLKKTIGDKFQKVFIIALLDGKRIDLQEAIKMSKK